MNEGLKCIGFIDISQGRTMGFVIPVFGNNETHYIQDYDYKTNKVIGFIKISSNLSYYVSHSNYESIKTGDSVLYGFKLPKKELFLGTKRQMTIVLSYVVTTESCSALLKLEISSFLKNGKEISRSQKEIRTTFHSTYPNFKGKIEFFAYPTEIEEKISPEIISNFGTEPTKEIKVEDKIKKQSKSTLKQIEDSHIYDYSQVKKKLMSVIRHNIHDLYKRTPYSHAKRVPITGSIKQRDVLVKLWSKHSMLQKATGLVAFIEEDQIKEEVYKGQLGRIKKAKGVRVKKGFIFKGLRKVR